MMTMMTCAGRPRHSHPSICDSAVLAGSTKSTSNHVERCSVAHEHETECPMPNPVCWFAALKDGAAIVHGYL
eukprot:7320991-Karenia_brevis.AAC.1